MRILNGILAAVAAALDRLHPDIPVYVDFVPQRLPERCFLLGFAGSPEVKHDLGRRYLVTGQLDIAYYSPRREAGLAEDLNSIFDSLSAELQSIAGANFRLRLPSHRREVVDGVLHDIAPFEVYLLKTDATPLMRRIAARGGLK